MQCNVWRKSVVYLTAFVLLGTLVIPTNAQGSRTILYVDDDAAPEWYDATHVKTIQEGITNASDGDTVFVYNGTYRENVLIDTSITLQGEHQNTTIIDGDETQSVIRVAVNYVTITGFTIQHCKQYYYGVSLSAHDYCTISGNRIIDNPGNGIQLSDSEHNIITDNFIGYNYRGINGEPFSNNNVISENTLCNNQRYSWVYGIVLILSSNNTISHNSFIGNSLLLRSTDQSKIINNTFTSEGISLTGDTSGDYYTATIENNFVNGKPIRFYKLQENIVVPIDTAQVILSACNNITISNTTFSDVDLPVHLINSRHCTISHNTITGADTGVYLYYMCRNNMITENTILQNNEGIVVEFWSPESNMISGNIIRDNHENGIALYDSTKSIIDGNRIEENGNGIRLEPGWGPCARNTIVQNHIVNNRYKGLWMLGATENTVKWNTISDNQYGISLLGARTNIFIENKILRNEKGIYSDSSTLDNLVYRNNLIDNTQNAYDSGSNQWDNSTIREGNYWSDYSPYQGYYTIPGGGNIDQYPLVSPIESAAIFPCEYSLIQGRYFSGGLSDLFNSDDHRLILQAGLTANKREQPVWVEIQGTAPIRNPEWLKFTLEAKVNSQNIVQRILLFNYEKQRWDEVDCRPATIHDQIVLVSINENPSWYINQSTGVTKAQLIWKSYGPTVLFPWQIGIDQAVWNAAVFMM